MIKLPKKKYTPKQDVQLGKEAASEVRKQYPIIEDQHIAKYLTQSGIEDFRARGAGLNCQIQGAILPASDRSGRTCWASCSARA